jgi:hypothetical protein
MAHDLSLFARAPLRYKNMYAVGTFQMFQQNSPKQDEYIY